MTRGVLFEGAAPVVAVVRLQGAESPDVVAAIVAGGVSSIELTLTTPGVMEQFGRIREQVGDAVSLGVGTLRTVDQVKWAVDAGADFLVAPHTDAALIRTGSDADVPFVPGALTPTEVAIALDSGAEAIKVFPAGATTPGLVRQLRGPFPGLQFMPSGGIGLPQVEEWLGGGAFAVSVGTPLTGTGEDLEAVTARSREFVAAARAAQEASR